MYKNILLATDGSELSARAVNDGVALAKALGAKITAVTVVLPWHIVAPGEVMVAFPEDEYRKESEARAQKVLGEVSSLAGAAGVVCDSVHVTAEHPWKAITETANDKGCDLIVMGSHGRSGLAKLMLGSETQKVVTNSKIPVLVHR